MCRGKCREFEKYTFCVCKLIEFASKLNIPDVLQVSQWSRRERIRKGATGYRPYSSSSSSEVVVATELEQTGRK